MELLRDLWAMDKSELRPLETAILAYLITHKAHDHEVFPSQQTIADRLGCYPQAVKHSLANLKERGFLLKRSRQLFNDETKRRGMSLSSGLTVNLAKIPARPEAKQRAMPSADALEFANIYMGFRTDRKTFPKGFKGTQEHAAQRILDACGGDLDHAIEVFNFANQHPTFYASTTHSLYRVAHRWAKIQAAFNAERATDSNVIEFPAGERTA
jgi:hypothetical protein